MAKTELRGKWALVTGASSGLGVDFATELARRGMNVVLVARRRERLDALAARLSAEHGVEAKSIAMDLAVPEVGAALEAEVASLGLEVEVLVNNAGYGAYGEHLELAWERERAMLQLDIVTLVDLTKRFAKAMVARGSGRILQVASIGAYMPCPTYATYAAAKVFVLHYGEALNFELKGTGVTCSVVSPGVTATEFLQVSGQKPTLYQRLMMMTSAQVARVGIRAMLRGKPSVVPGWLNKLTAWSMRFTPRRLMAWSAWFTMKQPG